MLGSGLKKMAKETGLKMDRGIAYGNYMGYAVTLSEGSGYKMLGISSKCTDENKVKLLQQKMEEVDLEKKYRITSLTLFPEGICVMFHDNPGTMKRYREFTDWFLPQLREYGYMDCHYCPMCGQLLDGQSSWRLEEIAMHVHDRCAVSREQEKKALVEQIKNEDTGNYGTGLLGAVLGGLLGAIPWAIVLYLGYVASVMGFLISLMAGKGYDLLHGKMGKGKIPIVMFASVLGVVCGNILSDVASVAVMIGQGELYGAAFSDIPEFMMLLFQDGEYIDIFLRNLGLGLFFAVLGMIGMIWKIYREDPTRLTSSKTLK